MFRVFLDKYLVRKYPKTFLISATHFLTIQNLYPIYPCTFSTQTTAKTTSSGISAKSALGVACKALNAGYQKGCACDAQSHAATTT